MKIGKPRSFDVIHPGSIIKLDLIGNYPFNTKYLLAADLDFFLRLPAKEINYFYFEKNLVEIGSEGISHGKNSKKIYFLEYQQIQNELNIRLKITFSFYLKLILEKFRLTNSYSRKLYWELNK